MERMVMDLLGRFASRVLELDAAAADALAELEGRVFALQLRGTELCCYLRVADGRVQLQPEAPGRVDVTIRGRPAEIARYAAASLGVSEGLAGGRLEIEGDVALAQRLQGLFRELEPDWEEALSRYIGDLGARKVANRMRATGRWAREARRSLAMDLSEYLRFEQQLLPDRTEAGRFSADVDDLRDDVQRLRQRVDRIAARGIREG